VEPTDQALLDAFVSACTVQEADRDSHEYWLPVACATEPQHLVPLYAKLPGRFPPLYERFALSYRWPLVDLPMLSLLANPQGPTLGGLLAEMRQDKGLWEELAPRGLIPFGRGGGGSYDPVFFDTRYRHGDGDCRVVQIDHEEILCSFRIREVAEIADSFRRLVLAVVEHGAVVR